MEDIPVKFIPQTTGPNLALVANHQWHAYLNSEQGGVGDPERGQSDIRPWYYRLSRGLIYPKQFIRYRGDEPDDLDTVHMPWSEYVNVRLRRRRSVRRSEHEFGHALRLKHPPLMSMDNVFDTMGLGFRVRDKHRLRARAAQWIKEAFPTKEG